MPETARTLKIIKNDNCRWGEKKASKQNSKKEITKKRKLVLDVSKKS